MRNRAVAWNLKLTLSDVFPLSPPQTALLTEKHVFGAYWSHFLPSLPHWKQEKGWSLRWGGGTCLPTRDFTQTNNFLDCLKGWRSLGHEYWPCPSCEQSGRQVEVVVGIGEPVDWTTYMPPRTRPRVLNWPTPTFTTYKNCTFKTVLSPEHKATTGLSERSLSVAPTMIV